MAVKADDEERDGRADVKAIRDADVSRHRSGTCADSKRQRLGVERLIIAHEAARGGDERAIAKRSAIDVVEQGLVVGDTKRHLPLANCQRALHEERTEAVAGLHVHPELGIEPIREPARRRVGRQRVQLGKNERHERVPSGRGCGLVAGEVTRDHRTVDQNERQDVRQGLLPGRNRRRPTVSARATMTVRGRIGLVTTVLRDGKCLAGDGHVPVRWEVPAFGETSNVMVPVPFPAAPVLTVIHAALVVEVQADASCAATDGPLVQAVRRGPARRRNRVGAGRRARLRHRERFRPAIVKTLPVRCVVPLFAATVTLALPLPVPVAPPVMVSQRGLVAVHAHPRRCSPRSFRQRRRDRRRRA